jgi:hypothetical protein
MDSTCRAPEPTRTAWHRGDSMATRSAPKGLQECPFLVPVMADHLWLRPLGGYCRGPDGRVRVPARSTLTCICTTPAYLLCPGYLRQTGPREGTPALREIATSPVG